MFVSRKPYHLHGKIMETTPNELLAHILTFLHPIDDHLAFLSLVCKRWKAVIEETPCLWKCIHITRVYPFGTTENAKQRNVLRICLSKFGRYVNCLRDHAIAKTFTDPSLRDLLVGLTSLICLDVPLLEWDAIFLKRLQCAKTLEELNLTQYLHSEPAESMPPRLLQQPETLQRSFVTPQHLQIIRHGFPQLKTLKLALDSVALPPSALISFLNRVNLTNLKLFGFGLSHTLSPRIIHNRDMCLKMISSSQRLAALVTRLELRTCPLCFTSDHLRVMLRLMKSLRHLFVGSGMIHRDSKSLLSIESESLLTLGLDGLSTLRMQCLRCNTPELKEFYLTNCIVLTAAFVYSKNLEVMYIRNLSKFYNLKTSSTHLLYLEIAACPMMPVSTLRNFLREHQTIKKLSIIGELTGLTLYGSMCPHLRALNVLLYRVSKLSTIKVDCPSLETFACDVYERGPQFIDDFSGSIPYERSTCSIFINSRKLERVSIHLPNATAISVKCEEIKYLSIVMRETASERKAPLDFQVFAESLSFVRTTNCKFSRYHLRSRHIQNIIVQLCEIESNNEGIPGLDIRTKFIDNLALENCHDIECAELFVQTDKAARHVSFTGCSNLRTVVMSSVVKYPPKIFITKCRNLESIFLPFGNQLSLSNVEVTGWSPIFNIPRQPESCRKVFSLAEN